MDIKLPSKKFKRCLCRNSPNLFEFFNRQSWFFKKSDTFSSSNFKSFSSRSLSPHIRIITMFFTFQFNFNCLFLLWALLSYLNWLSILNWNLVLLCLKIECLLRSHLYLSSHHSIHSMIHILHHYWINILLWLWLINWLWSYVLSIKICLILYCSIVKIKLTFT